MNYSGEVAFDAVGDGLVAGRPRPLRNAIAAGLARRWQIAISILLGAAAIGAAIGLLTTSGFLISKAALKPPILTLTVTIVAVRAFGVSRAALRYFERIVSHDAAFRSLARLRVKFFSQLVPLVPSAKNRDRSDLLARFVADVDALQDLYLRAISPPAIAAVVTVGVTITAWLLLPIAAAAIVIGLVIAGVVVPAISVVAASSSGRDKSRARAALTRDLVDALGGVREVAAFEQQATQRSRVVTSDRGLAKSAKRDAFAGGVATALGTFASGATVAAVAALGVVAVADGSIRGVWFGALVFLALSAFEAVDPMPAAATSLRGCAESARRIDATVTEPVAVSDPVDPTPVPTSGPLEFRSVRFSYDRQAPWLIDEISLTLAPGARIALIGPSGIGKTTMANLMVRFHDPVAGSIAIGGVDLRDLRQNDVREVVRLADQSAHLFNTSIAENVRLANREATDDQILSALDRAGLADWIASLPDGVETAVGEAGSMVSGGQRQRIAFARALVSTSRFIVMDEPTAHLDADGARDFLQSVAANSGDRGVLVITHTLEGLERFNQVFELRDGRLTPAAQTSHR